MPVSTHKTLSSDARLIAISLGKLSVAPNNDHHQKYRLALHPVGHNVRRLTVSRADLEALRDAINEML